MGAGSSWVRSARELLDVEACTSGFTAVSSCTVDTHLRQLRGDGSDLYSPALFAFWVMQHERTGNPPYVHEIEIPSLISGTF